jgi:uncharacterized membrane protein YccF (DUF307 family)
MTLEPNRPTGDDTAAKQPAEDAPAADVPPTHDVTLPAISVPADSTVTVTVQHETRGPGLLIRALWYIFIGWWLSGVVSVAAWLVGLTVIGLPLTFWIFNRLPTVLTLRPRRTSTTSTADAAGNVHIVHQDHPQPAFWKRALYFICVGWWFSAIWIVIAWILGVLIITIPLAVMMQNRLPAITTLHRY